MTNVNLSVTQSEYPNVKLSAFATVLDHSIAYNRELDNQHPIGSITGLISTLSNKLEVSNIIEGGNIILEKNGNNITINATSLDTIWGNITGVLSEQLDLAEALVAKVDKEDGKGLSVNDYTDLEKDKLENIEEEAQVNKIEIVKVNGTALTIDVNKSVDIDLSAYTTDEEMNTALGLKVDKVAGKGLSTNDLTNTLKTNYDTAYTNNHTHSNKSLLDTYTQTDTDLTDAVSKKHSHSNMTALNLVSGTNTGDETSGTIITKLGYTPANDTGVVHTTGDESIGGSKNFDSNTLFIDSVNHRIGAGTITPSKKLHVLSTSGQLRLGYNDSNYLDIAVGSTGNVDFMPTSGAVYFDMPNKNNQFFVYDYRDDTSTYMTFSALDFNMRDSGTSAIRLNATPNQSSYINNGGNVGIGTSTPNYKLDVMGTTANSSIRSAIGFDIHPVPDPTTLSVVVSSGGNVDDGAHYYAVTFITALGESHPFYANAITTSGGNNTVTLTIPISTDTRVTGRKIYRTKADRYMYEEYLLATINDNTTTTYVDTVADSTLTGSAGLAYFRVNTTTNGITVDGEKVLTLDTNATYIGKFAGKSVTTGGRNFFAGYNSGGAVTSGGSHTFIGYAAGSSTTTSSFCNGFGTFSLNQNTTGAYNSGFGNNTLFYNQTGLYNTAMGAFALSGTSGSSFNYNTATGAYALNGVSTGSNNTADGFRAGYYIADGITLNTTGNNSVFIGDNTRPQANGQTNQIVIGHEAVGNGSNTATLGNDNITKTVLKGNVLATTINGERIEDKIEATNVKAGSGIAVSVSGNDVTVLATGSSGMSNPMTTAGDIIIGGTSGTPNRLSIGTTGQVLKVVSGAPAWSNEQDISGKANVAADNFSTAGKALLASLGMPSNYDTLTLGASGSTYTAPANGYLLLSKNTGTATEYIALSNSSNGYVARNTHGGTAYLITVSIPVLKNQTITYTYNASGTLDKFRFYYAEGN